MRFNRFGLRTLLLSGGAVSIGAALVVATSNAQPPARGEAGGNGVEAAIKRLMAFDANGDGKLSKDEITDARLLPLFQKADANSDGVVTKEELTAQLTKDAAAQRGGGFAPGGPGGPGGAGPGFDGPGGRGGPGGGGPGGGGPGFGGPGGPGRGGPGQVLPPFLQDELNLTEAQRKQIDDLQKDVDARLAKILTADQQQQLQQIRSRGPGGRGPGGGGPGGGPGGAGPGGRGGFGPPDGGPRGGNDNGRPQRPQ